MISVSWHPLARRDLFEASDFYEEESPGLGDAFLEEVERSILQLVEFPLSGHPTARKKRRCVLRRFPYNIVYGIERDQLFIVAIAHHKRHPRYWAARRMPPPEH